MLFMCVCMHALELFRKWKCVSTFLSQYPIRHPSPFCCTTPRVAALPLQNHGSKFLFRKRLSYSESRANSCSVHTVIRGFLWEYTEIFVEYRLTLLQCLWPQLVKCYSAPSSKEMVLQIIFKKNKKQKNKH